MKEVLASSKGKSEAGLGCQRERGEIMPYTPAPGEQAPSEEAKRKAEAAKRFIENMYKMQSQNSKERRERYAKIVGTANLDKEIAQENFGSTRHRLTRPGDDESLFCNNQDTVFMMAISIRDMRHAMILRLLFDPWQTKFED